MPTLTRPRRPAERSASFSASPDSLSDLDQYLREVDSIPLMTREEEAAAARAARRGDEAALHALVSANLRFALATAKRFQGQGVPLQDLIQEANLGLLIAARKFDPDTGVKLISFAVWQIRARLLLAVKRDHRNVALPVHRADQVWELTRARNRLSHSLGRAPTRAELAAEVGLTEDVVGLLAAFESPELRLDVPQGADEGDSAMDWWLAAPSEDPVQALHATDLRACIDAALAAFPSRLRRHAEAVRLFYGLDGVRLTDEQIAEALGVTRGRVYQLRQLALARLRKALAPFRPETST